MFGVEAYWLRGASARSIMAMFSRLRQTLIGKGKSDLGDEELSVSQDIPGDEDLTELERARRDLLVSALECQAELMRGQSGALTDGDGRGTAADGEEAVGEPVRHSAFGRRPVQNNHDPTVPASTLFADLVGANWPVGSLGNRDIDKIMGQIVADDIADFG